MSELAGRRSDAPARRSSVSIAAVLVLVLGASSGCVAAAPSITPSMTVDPSATPGPTACLPTPAVSFEPGPSASPVPGGSASPGPSSTSSASPTPEPTASASPEPTPDPSPTPSVGPTATIPPTARPRPTPTARITPRPTAKASPPAASAPLVYHGPRTRRVVALTMDDCNAPAVVQGYLDLFARERVNATFFPVGSVLASNASLWRRVADAGFPIGNHSWSHPNLTKLSQSAIETELARAASAIRSATGRSPVPFMRPPGGSWNQSVLRAAARTGQAYVVLWDVTSGDTGRGTVAQVVANAIRGTSGSIVLFHANQARSVEAMALVIAHYRREGYGFVTLGQLFGLAGPVPFEG